MSVIYRIDGGSQDTCNCNQVLNLLIWNIVRSNFLPLCNQCIRSNMHRFSIKSQFSQRNIFIHQIYSYILSSKIMSDLCSLAATIKRIKNNITFVGIELHEPIWNFFWEWARMFDMSWRNRSLYAILNLQFLL